MCLLRTSSDDYFRDRVLGGGRSGTAPSPNQTAQQLAAFYADNAFRIRIGLVISMLAAGLTFPSPLRSSCR